MGSYCKCVSSDSSDDELVSAACVTPGVKLPTCDATVNDEPVEAVRDTGCTGVIVTHHLVKDHQFTGRRKTLVLANKERVKAPEARVKINCPYFKNSPRIVSCAVMETPIAELVIGNSLDPGYADSFKRSVSEKPRVKLKDLVFH